MWLSHSIYWLKSFTKQNISVWTITPKIIKNIYTSIKWEKIPTLVLLWLLKGWRVTKLPKVNNNEMTNYVTILWPCSVRFLMAKIISNIISNKRKNFKLFHIKWWNIFYYNSSNDTNLRPCEKIWYNFLSCSTFLEINFEIFVLFTIPFSVSSL